MRGVLLLLLACSGCGAETCPVLDLECFLRNLTLRDENGEDVPITVVKRESAESVIGPFADPTGLGGDPTRDFSVVEPMFDLRAPNDLSSGPAVMLGCFVDRADARDLSGTATYSSSMTREICAALCAGSPYFGLQDGAWCYCGTSYGMYGAAPPGDCYMTCNGNISQICGGYLRNTVYGKSGFVIADLAAERDLATAATSGGTTGGTSGGTAGGTSGGTPPAERPMIDLDSSSATIAPGMPAPIGGTLHDPNKCTPAFCMSMCRRGSRCATVMACAPPRRDGIIDGVWRSYLGTRVEPADAPKLEAILPLIGIGTTNCKDPIDDMKKVENGEPNPNTSGANAAPPKMIDLTVNKKEPSSGETTGSTGGTTGGSSGGSSGGGTCLTGYTMRIGSACCSTASPCCNGTFNACVWTNSAGGCVNQGYIYGGREYKCGCSDSGCVQNAANSIIKSCCPTP